MAQKLEKKRIENLEDQLGERDAAVERMELRVQELVSLHTQATWKVVQGEQELKRAREDALMYHQQAWLQQCLGDELTTEIEELRTELNNQAAELQNLRETNAQIHDELENQRAAAQTQHDANE